MVKTSVDILDHNLYKDFLLIFEQHSNPDLYKLSRCLPMKHVIDFLKENCMIPISKNTLLKWFKNGDFQPNTNMFLKKGLKKLASHINREICLSNNF